MKFLKTLEVKSPTRGTPQSAGIDFFVPEETENFMKLFKEKNPDILVIEKYGFMLEPSQRVNIPSGIKVEFDRDYALIAFNKSGISTNLGLDVGASVVDSDYTGMVHLSLTNTSDENVDIRFGQKIIQFVLIPVNYTIPTEVTSEEELFTRQSERGSGGFGSTGSF